MSIFQGIKKFLAYVSLSKSLDRLRDASDNVPVSSDLSQKYLSDKYLPTTNGLFTSSSFICFLNFIANIIIVIVIKIDSQSFLG